MSGDSKPSAAPTAAAPSPRPSRPRGARHARGPRRASRPPPSRLVAGRWRTSGARPEESAGRGAGAGGAGGSGWARVFAFSWTGPRNLVRAGAPVASPAPSSVAFVVAERVGLPAGRKMSAQPAGAAFLGPLKGTWLRLEQNEARVLPPWSHRTPTPAPFEGVLGAQGAPGASLGLATTVQDRPSS